jgi:hypothetical protein
MLNKCIQNVERHQWAVAILVRSVHRDCTGHSARHSQCSASPLIYRPVKTAAGVPSRRLLFQLSPFARAFYWSKASAWSSGCGRASSASASSQPPRPPARSSGRVSLPCRPLPRGGAAGAGCARRALRKNLKSETRGSGKARHTRVSVTDLSGVWVIQRCACSRSDTVL